MATTEHECLIEETTAKSYGEWGDFFVIRSWRR